tara:strand:+ start:29374 stop:29616 length:243 start_codon:yes stop_codon:yes gene_type:complete
MTYNNTLNTRTILRRRRANTRALLSALSLLGGAMAFICLSAALCLYGAYIGGADVFNMSLLEGGAVTIGDIVRAIGGDHA